MIQKIFFMELVRPIKTQEPSKAKGDERKAQRQWGKKELVRSLLRINSTSPVHYLLGEEEKTTHGSGKKKRKGSRKKTPGRVGKDQVIHRDDPDECEKPFWSGGESGELHQRRECPRTRKRTGGGRE